MITKEQRKQYLEGRGSLEAANTLLQNAFLRKCKLKFREKRGSGENFFIVRALYL
jgi:hypothetical protein